MATVHAPSVRWRRERIFFSLMALAILAAVFAGFAPSFYLRGTLPASHPLLPMTPLIVLHGLLFSGWILLFVAQVGLVSSGRTDVHRRLGLAGMVLLPAMIVVATLAALHGVARGSGPPGVPPLSWLAVPLLDIPVFTGLIGAALYFRSKPQVHKRLMLIAAIGLLPPAIGRMALLPLPLPLQAFLLADLYLLPLLAWDWATQGKIRPATLIGSAVVVGSHVLRLAIWKTPAWLAFAAWASGLVA